MLAYCVKLWPVVLHFKSRLVCFQLNFLLLHLERLPVLVQALAAHKGDPDAVLAPGLDLAQPQLLGPFGE